VNSGKEGGKSLVYRYGVLKQSSVSKSAGKGGRERPNEYREESSFHVGLASEGGGGAFAGREARGGGGRFP